MDDRHKEFFEALARLTADYDCEIRGGRVYFGPEEAYEIDGILVDETSLGQGVKWHLPN